ncbi:hypothetical protein RYZ27_05440 [Hyphomonas sp. FCG-A18]|uniref:hypothetical protein n=1 Tax=Hyphomonas sp. FCG-A18 TaxID=3080019 RepID=UPI002B2FE006|nr:hypothetical protein RYZ27_05440 [Hyphomonas sp. FCG-A18]
MSDIGMILDRIGRKLVTEVAPKLEGDYSGGHAGMSGLMAVMAGEMWDGAADRLFTEISDMRALLQAAGRQVQVPDAPSLKVSDLTAERDALARHLIEVQRDLEVREDEQSKLLNAQIWLFLIQTATARMPSPPDFPDAEG